MILILKKIISALILPPTSLILIALFGLGVSRSRPRICKTLVIVALITLLIFSLPITSNALMLRLESHPAITKEQLKEIQAIVILGGGRNSNAPEYEGLDTINSLTLERLRYGAKLQKESGKPILVSGGASFGGRPVADAMAESLTKDFHAKTIWVEGQANDTSENAIYSAEILKHHGITHIALVSQAWHLARAIPLFEKQGLKVRPAGTGYSANKTYSVTTWLPSASALDESSIALKEYFGIFLSK